MQEAEESQSVEKDLEGDPGGGRSTQYDPSTCSLPKRKEEAIARSLISGSLENDGNAGSKRTLSEGITHSRTKKKKTGQKPAMEMKTASLLQSIVPKLGPVVCIKPQDIDQLKKAIEGIRSGNKRSVEMGLNFMMTWSLLMKEMTYTEHVLEAIAVLIDFVVDVISFEPQTLQEKFGIQAFVMMMRGVVVESTQSALLISESMMQSMAACLILKNISVSLEKRATLGSVGKKIIQLTIGLLTGKIDEGGALKTIDTTEIPYSMIRDALHLLKMITSLEGMDAQLLSGMTRMLYDGSVPLRLRITILDVISVLLYQESIKDSVMTLLKADSVEMETTLKLFFMLPVKSAEEEALFELEGGMDYEGIAVFEDPHDGRCSTDLRMWSERLQSEALRVATMFLVAVTSSEMLSIFASDHFILQALVDLTTGKKLMDMDRGERMLIESKHPVVVATRRNIRLSETQTYRMILDVLQTSSPMKQKLRKFEDQFITSAFDNGRQAKQCAMVLSMMNGDEIDN